MTTTTADPAETTDTTPQQLQLFPDATIPVNRDTVLLEDLPDSSELAGEPDRGLVESVKRYGVLVPVMLVRRPDSTLVVAGGRRRIKAARLAGLDTIKAEVWVTDQPISHVLTVIENTQRSRNLASEAEAVRALRLERGLGDEQIAQITGLSKPDMDKLGRLTRLAQPLFEGLRDGKLKPSTALAIAPLPTAAQERLGGTLARNGRVTAADVKVERARIAAASPQQASLEGFDLEPEPSTPTTDGATATATGEEAEANAFLSWLGGYALDQITALVPNVEAVDKNDDGTLRVTTAEGDITLRLHLDFVGNDEPDESDVASDPDEDYQPDPDEVPTA